MFTVSTTGFGGILNDYLVQDGYHGLSNLRCHKKLSKYTAFFMYCYGDVISLF